MALKEKDTSLFHISDPSNPTLQWTWWPGWRPRVRSSPGLVARGAGRVPGWEK